MRFIRLPKPPDDQKFASSHIVLVPRQVVKHTTRSKFISRSNASDKEERDFISLSAEDIGGSEVTKIQDVELNAKFWE